jgi:pimeloyl-ACP methyl ester carboxylesterase
VGWLVRGLPGLGRQAGRIGIGAGVVAAGAVIGLAAERYAVGRSFRREDPATREPYGSIRGRSQVVTADDGVALHVEVHDPEPGAPDLTVVFCHGYALSSDAFHFQRRDLRDLGRLVLWDQRGHGRSGRGPMEHATIEQLGADLRCVLDAVVPDGPLVLVGHSMGGMTVMALADAHPELFGTRVVGVALMSTSPGRLAEVTFGVPAQLGRVVRRIAPGVLGAAARRPELVERGRRVGSDVGFVVTKRYSFASDVPASMVQFVADLHAATPIDVLAELFPAFDAHDKLAALPVLNGVETLILAGEGDLVTPAAHSEEMLRSVPGAELVVVPDAGHMVVLEHPAVVNEHLRALVRRAVRAAGPA